MFMCCLLVDIDECSSDPCMNGGTCTDDFNSYSCACVAGYTGETCDIGMCYVTQALFTLYAILGSTVKRHQHIQSVVLQNNCSFYSNYIHCHSLNIVK